MRSKDRRQANEASFGKGFLLQGRLHPVGTIGVLRQLCSAVAQYGNSFTE
jgi:hypothetical protein